MHNFKLLVRNAIRDSRKNRSKLLMFMSSIVLGIAAVVSINSFNDNLVKDIDKQTSSLIGADIVVEGNKEAEPNILSILDSIPGENAMQLEMLSMALIPKTGNSQIVNLKAIEGNFPFYGKINTIPEESALNFKDSNSALVDAGLLKQESLEIGDSIRLGKIDFIIAGSLQNAFGGAGIASSFAPSIYIGYRQILPTGLVTEGSLVNYSYFKKTDPEFKSDEWRDNYKDNFRTENFRITTVNSQKRRLSRAFNYLGSFLNLVALISLLLGCIGVASSIYIYIKAKTNSIAIFRCLGMSSKNAFLMYLIQVLFWGILAIIAGIILGSMIQLLLPKLLSEFLPFEVSTSLSMRAILEASGIGLIITSLFSILPLLSIRNISPLRILRSGVQEEVSRDKLQWLVIAGIVLSIFSFLLLLTNDLQSALGFTIGLMVSYALLILVAKLAIWSVKTYFPRNWSFVFRQGLSNLFRPNNQTQTLLVSIGLGTAILSTLFIVQSLLLSNVSKMDAGKQPNVVLYGINPTQQDSIADLTKAYEMPLIQQVPIVTVNLEEWKGKSKSEWVKDTSNRIERWALSRETRVTYRDSLIETEELVEGEFIGAVETNTDSVFISLGDDYAEALNVELGDEMIWNVQGMRLRTFVSSIRSINYSNMNARFFIVFPLGVLEQAPQFQVLITKSPSKEKTASYRSAVVKKFPNVSVVDLSTILKSLNEILNKISYIIQFMAGFSILTGLIVLIASLLLSKFQRVKESVLLRTLGASTKQILSIFTIEYFLIGFLSAITGIFLAIVSSYIITSTQLDLTYDVNWINLVFVLIFVVMLTVIIGVINSIEVIKKSPLEVLRNELA